MPDNTFPDHDRDRTDVNAIARLRASTPPPSAGVLSAARSDLLDRLEAPRPVAYRAARRRWTAALAAAASVAALATGALIVSSRDTDHSAAGPGTSDVPTQPAATSPPAPVPAAFTHITSHTWSISEAALKDRAVWYLTEGTSQQWVPADWSQTWYWRNEYNTAGRFLDGSDLNYVHTHAPELLDTGSSTSSGKNGVPDDGHLACGPGACQPGWDYVTTDFIAQLPTDTAALRASLYADAQKLSDEANHYGKTDDVDSQAFEFVTSMLELGYLPTDLQSALYAVATTIPGVTTVASETNLDDARGVGLRRLDRFGAARTDLIFTAPGGQYLGSRQVVVSPDWNSYNDSNTDPPQPITHVPVGTVISDTAISVESADSPPSIVGSAVPLPASGTTRMTAP